MTSDQEMDAQLVASFVNDLKYLTDAQLIREARETQDLVDRETSWVEAVTAEQRIRARATC